ncbi:glycosyl hydrolases family 18 protein [Colletotrichum tabaci]|uniref:Glycosyl hydrolases family 18 protein n=1 Tax=Colletotrichum tabaci TaxID=1209068 RepID=A0AAV9T5K5_9PEZI
MVLSSARTFEASVDNLSSSLREYAFDGELDDANKKQPIKYAVPFTASTSHWHLRHFDLETADHVDFMNAMLYDLHGAWGLQEPSKIWHLRVHKPH